MHITTIDHEPARCPNFRQYNYSDSRIEIVRCIKNRFIKHECDFPARKEHSSSNNLYSWSKTTDKIEFTPCPHPEHNPPAFCVFPAGWHEHTCPGCKTVTKFYVSMTTWQ